MLKRLGLDETLDRSAVSGYELGTREPPLPILLEYARVAGVCVDVLIDDKSYLPAVMPGTPKHRTGRRR
jgi:hypothetical protein